MDTSARLATPRSGSKRLNWADGPVPNEQDLMIAAWQTTEKGAPKRCVIRCDGKLEDQAASRNAQGKLLTAGFPCAVLAVRYTIGGITQQVLVDAGGQSALTVWAESIDVVPVWDTRRIKRISNYIEPCLAQTLAATINSGVDAGDTGPSDARWLDAIASDATTGDAGKEWSIHPIPAGARGFRFLDVLVAGVMTSVPGLTVDIVWSTDTFDQYPNGFVQCNTNGATDTSILIAPPLARYLFLSFPFNTLVTFDTPSFIEWIMAPATLPGF